MKPRCVLDMDGVIADFHGGIARAFGVPFKWSSPNVWTVEEGLGIPGPWHSVCNEAFWENLGFTECAAGLLELIASKFKLDEICVMTHYPLEMGYGIDYLDQCYVGKMKWLQRKAPALASHFIMTTAPKSFAASPWSVLIDDSDKNCQEFIEAGGNAIVVPRPWNSLHDCESFGVQMIADKLYHFFKGLK